MEFRTELRLIENKLHHAVISDEIVIKIELHCWAKMTLMIVMIKKMIAHSLFVSVPVNKIL